MTLFAKHEQAERERAKPLAALMRRWPFVVGCLVVGYPLSIGPTVWLVRRFDLSVECWELVYTPLFWLGQQFDWFGTLLIQYLSLFVKSRFPEP